MKTVVLIGCGNIGFRHLQALARMATPCDIRVVEPNAAAHPRIEAECAAQAGGPHRFRLLPGLDDPQLPGAVDLAVIATNTGHRRAAWDGLRARARVGAVIFEKVLFPTLADIDAVAADLAAGPTAGFVNCGRRGFPDYQALARRFGGQGIAVDVDVTGNSFGLASNAVHFLDLAEFLNGAEIAEVRTDGLAPGGKPSKRDGYVEIFGTLEARLTNGARLRVTCADAEGLSVGVALTGRDGSRIVIDEVAARRTEGGTETAFSLRRVSEMVELYETILTRGDSDLVGYAASARQHRAYIRALCAHLGLPVTPDQTCPIS